MRIFLISFFRTYCILDITMSIVIVFKILEMKCKSVWTKIMFFYEAMKQLNDLWSQSNPMEPKLSTLSHLSLIENVNIIHRVYGIKIIMVTFCIFICVLKWPLWSQFIYLCGNFGFYICFMCYCIQCAHFFFLLINFLASVSAHSHSHSFTLSIDC